MENHTGVPQMNMLEPSLDELVRKSHPYRQLLVLLDFKKLCAPLADIRSHLGRDGYDLEAGFAALLLQWMEGLSDREMERFLQENTATKYFCGFTLTGCTPDHSYFGRLRASIGTEKLAIIFNNVNESLRKNGVISDIFTFVDASSMISKLTTWEERDKAIKAGEERLNNANIGDYSSDKDARFGCKGYENVFSKKQKRSRYRGIEKNQFQGLIEALVFNFKRLISINAPPIFA